MSESTVLAWTVRVAGSEISRYPAGMAKVLVSLDDQLLLRIDKAARSQGLSRSAYLSRLAAREVEAPHGPGRAAATHHALKKIDELFAANKREGDATRAVRQERNSH